MLFRTLGATTKIAMIGTILELARLAAVDDRVTAAAYVSGAVVAD
jgi:hypothetical protein